MEVEERVRLLQKNEDPKHPILTGTTGESLCLLSAPDAEIVKQQLQQVYDQGIRSIAVVFMHAYTFHNHEKFIGKLAEEMGFTQISLSHEVMPRVKIVPRGDTATVEAYLTPHIQSYLQSFRSGFVDKLKNTAVWFMQSDGGLVEAERFRGANAILSGPAGGVVGYACTTNFSNKDLKQTIEESSEEESHQEAGSKKAAIIGFDMGGTSTDVSRYGGAYELVHECETAGVRIQASQMDIRTVAAGGGSRLLFQNGLFEVGPDSVGAHPGPVCYRKNGNLAVTDANLFLGRLHPDFFPHIFGETEDQALDAEATCFAFETITKEINEYQVSGSTSLRFQVPRSMGASSKVPCSMSEAEVAQGFLEVANEVMARAIREISVMRGFDIQEHVLACFGGAGGQHACALARKLGIPRIFIHRFSGILSAYGMGLADVVVEQQEPAAMIYCSEANSNVQVSLQNSLDRLVDNATQELLKQGYVEDQIEVQRYLNLRYEGTDSAIMVQKPDEEDAPDFLQSFLKTHQREFGFVLQNRNLIVDDIRVRAIAKSVASSTPALASSASDLKPEVYTRCYFEGKWHKTPLYNLEKIGVGIQLSGPALLIQDTSTIVLEPHCHAEITVEGGVSIEVELTNTQSISSELDPVQLSIFGHLFMSIAEQMGRTLQRTAISTNIKERHDFSCAVFDESGNLVANAPHQPVHLGSMSEAVRQQIRLQGKTLKLGDVWVSNHPVSGGTHLPDITVITPVWSSNDSSEVPVFFVASRGHHADIGGCSPGSMPPFSRTLDEEGAAILGFKLVEQGEFQEEAILEILKESRNVQNNISDLKAQIAANQRGITLLQELIAHYSLNIVQAYMRHIQNNAESAVRNMFRSISVPSEKNETSSDIAVLSAKDFLDDGSTICIKITINRKEGSAIFDFEGTGCELWRNLNAPSAVTQSAILYVLRCLVQQNIPLNQGCLTPIQIKVPQGSLLAPSENAAVAGGNVLTSQRITDVLLKAFHAVAASQGCTNNLTFGNETFGYYETIGGGSGAGASWHGASGVHTHMTNTRITDPEILERRFPVMLREFSLRQGSGGKGKFCGGEGMIREIEFLEPLNVGILSERRVYQPYGLEGGEPGSCGTNHFIRNNGTCLNLGSTNEISANLGDSIRITTPGGGGFGSIKNPK